MLRATGDISSEQRDQPIFQHAAPLDAHNWRKGHRYSRNNDAPSAHLSISAKNCM